MGESKALDIHNVEKLKESTDGLTYGPCYYSRKRHHFYRHRVAVGGWVEQGDTEDRNTLVCFYCIYCFLEAGDNLVYKIFQTEAQTITRPIQLRYIDLPMGNKGQRNPEKKFFWKDTDEWSSKKAVPIHFNPQCVYVCILYI